MEAAAAESEAGPYHQRDGGHLDHDHDRRSEEKPARQHKADQPDQHEQQSNKRGRPDQFL
jgi:hypothetical protein